MIPKTFHLFWSGGPLSFLRYLTVKTLRHHHPHWKIKLWTSPKAGYARWAYEKQDFQADLREGYWGFAEKHADEVCEWNGRPDEAPNYQSDFFRWEVLSREGGWWMDFDQIILKPFDEMFRHDFVFAAYQLPEYYTPVGVIGARPGLSIVDHINETLSERVKRDNYNSAGPYMMRDVLREYGIPANSYNSGTSFYPIPYSSGVKAIYDGTAIVPTNSYALHWFGGHPLSQEFNKDYKWEDVETGKDWISKYMRSLEG